MAHPPLRGASLFWVTLALSMAVFMQVLDSTIANVALPTISGNLGAATSQGTWVITSFAVANAISVPLTGWLAKRFGEVRTFLVATVLFVLASWLCGIAPSLELLIVFRVLQGAVAGPMIPLSQSLLLAAYPPEKRSMALALWSMTIIVAPIFGPILGGIISDNWHWGWIFFINVPIGVAVIWITYKQLHHRETEVQQQPIDYLGLGLLVVGVGALQMILDRGKELDWFASTEIMVLCTIAVVSLSYLVVWELGSEHPIVDLKLFKIRNFTVGVLALSLAFMVYMGAIVLLPLVMQTQLGYTATWAGLASAPVGILPVLLSPIIGKFGTRLDMRVLVTISFTTYALCFWWRTDFHAQMDFWDIFWPQFWQGLGMSMFFLPLTQITLSRIEPKNIASASSLSNFIRILAGGIGTSIVTTVWERREAVHHAHLVESITPYNSMSVEMQQQMAQMGLNSAQQSALINQTITQQAYIISSNEIFYAGAAVFVLLIALVWIAKPPFNAGGGDGGAH